MQGWPLGWSRRKQFHTVKFQARQVQAGQFQDQAMQFQALPYTIPCRSLPRDSRNYALWTVPSVEKVSEQRSGI